MRLSTRSQTPALLLLLLACLPHLAAAQQSDAAVAERILGTQWKELSRRSGMIFAGTLLRNATPAVPTQISGTDRTVSGTTPAVTLSFRVDEAIAGVKPRQVLTIREWSGTAIMNRPLRTGRHVLIFLYPPSHLGLTSPVGGAMGQVILDASGNSVADDEQKFRASIMSSASALPNSDPGSGNVSLMQLERAIRHALAE